MSTCMPGILQRIRLICGAKQWFSCRSKRQVKDLKGGNIAEDFVSHSSYASYDEAALCSSKTCFSLHMHCMMSFLSTVMRFLFKKRHNACREPKSRHEDSQRLILPSSNELRAEGRSPFFFRGSLPSVLPTRAGIRGASALACPPFLGAVQWDDFCVQVFLF